MKQSAHRERLILMAFIASLCAAPTFRGQTPDDLESTARSRIEEARSSMVVVKAENESGQTVSQAAGFLIRNDLVATDAGVLKDSSRLSVTSGTKEGALKVVSRGNYFLPYILVEKQSEFAPLRLGDSDAVTANDKVYMIDDHGKISAGTVTGTTTIKNTPAFLITLAINATNKGVPIFNRNGEVIGIAAERPDGGGAGLAFPSSLLAKLQHLGEPGVGVGAGDGRLHPHGPSISEPGTSAASAVDEKPVRLKASLPRYTEAARANKTQGTVTVRVLVGTDGDVKQVAVIRGLPDGLTEQAIEAARQTKFKPAMKDGKPVPYWVMMQMDFNIR
jgi:TonB family protein